MNVLLKDINKANKKNVGDWENEFVIEFEPCFTRDGDTDPIWAPGATLIYLANFCWFESLRKYQARERGNELMTNRVWSINLAISIFLLFIFSWLFLQTVENAFTFFNFFNYSIMFLSLEILKYENFKLLDNYQTELYFSGSP